MNALWQHVNDVYVPTIQVIWPALLAAAALAGAAGVMGVFVLLRREALVALALPQLVTLGAALGLRLGWPALPPALGVVFVALLLLAGAKQNGFDALILPALYAAGSCLAVLLIVNEGAHLIEVQNLFTGIDVAVDIHEGLITAGVLIGAGLTGALLWRRWLLLAQAPATAELAGVRPARWNAAFLTLLSIVIVLGTSTLGAVMIVALLFLPAAAVLPWTRRVPVALLASVGAAGLFLGAGFVLSVEMNWPLSQSVGGAGCAAVFAAHVLAALVRRR